MMSLAMKVRLGQAKLSLYFNSLLNVTDMNCYPQNGVKLVFVLSQTDQFGVLS